MDNASKIFDRFGFDQIVAEGIETESIEYDDRVLTWPDVLRGHLSPHVAAEPVTAIADQTIESYLAGNDERLAQEWAESDRTYGFAVPLLAKVKGIEVESIA